MLPRVHLCAQSPRRPHTSVSARKRSVFNYDHDRCAPRPKNESRGGQTGCCRPYNNKFYAFRSHKQTTTRFRPHLEESDPGRRRPPVLKQVTPSLSRPHHVRVCAPARTRLLFRLLPGVFSPFSPARSSRKMFGVGLWTRSDPSYPPAFPAG